MERVVGIDLGTTFSAVAYINDETGRAEVIPDPETQDRVTPSVVLFEDHSNVIVGKMAKENAVAEPLRVVEFVKRSMGKPMGHPPEGWQFDLGSRTYSAQEISAIILKKLKQDAETRLKQPITKAVITVPAYFAESQRAATAEAGRIAGLEVMAILDEPVAAALAYGLDRLDRNQRVFVFDLGGGTFDVTIIDIVNRQIREIAINGDHLLGGKDWDDEIIRYVCNEFAEKFGCNPQDDLASYQDLQLRAIRAKEELSRIHKARIVVHHAGNSLTVELTRDKFEELTQHLVERCRSLCELVLSEADATWDAIDTVLLVGGSTKMPMIQNLVREISGKEPSTDVNPDECVAQGAAWQAMLMQMEPNSAARTEWMTKNPALAKKVSSVKIHKITSRELGVVVVNASGDELSVLMIDKFTPLPCSKSDEFGTVVDNQISVTIRVTEGGLYLSDGECNLDDCKILGEVFLDDLPPHPAHSPIRVTYSFSEDGLLEVTGVDVLSGRSARSEIRHPGGLTADEMTKAIARVKTAEVRS